MGAVTPTDLTPTFYCHRCLGTFKTGFSLKDVDSEYSKCWIPKGTVIVPYAGCYHCGNPYIDWTNYKDLVKAGRING